MPRHLTYRQWTTKEIDDLERMRVEEGLTNKECAARLGRTWKGVAQMATRIEARRTTLTMTRLNVLNSPLPPRQAAEMLDCSYATVVNSRSRLRRAGFDITDGRAAANQRKRLG